MSVSRSCMCNVGRQASPSAAARSRGGGVVQPAWSRKVHHLKPSRVAPMLRIKFRIGGIVVYVVLLALVAGFLALRLYAVLGKRTGHEHPLPRAAEEGQIAGPAQRPVLDIPSERRDTASPVVDPAAETGVRAIAMAEPGFSPEQFVDGAKSAYKMILEAFW